MMENPIAYTCVMGGPAAIKGSMNALGLAFGFDGDNFTMLASGDGDPPETWAYGYNDGVSVGWRNMIVDRVFDVPESMTEAQINDLLDAMRFLFRPIPAGQSGRDVRSGQIDEYLAAIGLTRIEVQL
jgi:hypothetical protein